jgi:hypothetical protein
VNDTTDDLIQRALEGDITAGERASLEARLASDAAARGRYDELSRAFEALGAARLEEPPAGLRDEVMRAVRGAAPAWAPASARAGRAEPVARPVVAARRPSFTWLRIALPVAAGAVAAFVLFGGLPGGPGQQPAGDGVSGTMSGVRPATGLTVGSGASAVTVHWSPTGTGFQVRLQAGDAPVHVVLETPTAGTLLSLAPGTPTPSPRVEATLPAHAFVVAEGTASTREATLRVSVTLPDGRLASGEVGLRNLPRTR